MQPHITFIAEVKPVSPFGWKSDYNWDQLLELANEYGDMLSIHTDPRWGGSFDALATARRRTRKPIVAKGIHPDDELIARALEAGADWVLVVGRLPKLHADRCWIEPLTLDQLRSLPPGTKAVWNSRELSSGGLKPETFDQARAAWDGWLCQASNIRTMTDIHPAANAALVGSHLPEFIVLNR